MAKYRKRPVVVEAIQWLGDNTAEVNGFIEGKKQFKYQDFDKLTIYAEQDIFSVFLGDFIVKRVNGCYETLSQTDFYTEYEEILIPIKAGTVELNINA